MPIHEEFQQIPDLFGHILSVLLTAFSKETLAYGSDPDHCEHHAPIGGAVQQPV